MELIPFYFLRHGKTQANLDGLMCGGKWDLPLCDEGIEQVMHVALRLSQMKAALPTAIYASPLIRARHTAEIVAQTLGLPIAFIHELREWDLGDWDRLPFEQVKKDFLGSPDPVNGESRVVFQKRVTKALNLSLKLGGTPLLVSHGGVGLAVQDILGISRVRLENAAALQFLRNAQGVWEMHSLLQAESTAK